jgi:hypothetical protein
MPEAPRPATLLGKRPSCNFLWPRGTQIKHVYTNPLGIEVKKKLFSASRAPLADLENAAEAEAFQAKAAELKGAGVNLKKKGFASAAVPTNSGSG